LPPADVPARAALLTAAGERVAATDVATAWIRRCHFLGFSQGEGNARETNEMKRFPPLSQPFPSPDK
jgi:hypothetical protein